MSGEAPRVFISHAREDKDAFAEPLARALRAKGVDAWLDRWEIKYGDSLVERIFEEGLADAGTFVYLMSQNSVAKDWVRAELENAVVQRINKKIRLIPVKLSHYNVPNAVNSILWMDLEKLGSLEKVADEIARVVHNYSDRPEIGQKPKWASPSSLSVRGLDKQDEVVLGLVFQAAMDKGTWQFIQNSDLKPLADAQQIDEESLHDSIEMLISRGYLEQENRTFGSRRIVVNIFVGTFISIASFLGLPVETCRLELAGLLFNEEVCSIPVIKKRLKDYPEALVEAVLEELRRSGHLRVERTLGGGGFVTNPSIEYKRWFRDVSQK